MPQVHEKIRVKGSEKVFKSGRPGRCGKARLERRVHALLLAAHRLGRKGPPSADTQYAARLIATLQLFLTEATP
jgi:hypothetical protein